MGVSVFSPSQRRSQILTSVVFGLAKLYGRPQSAKPLKDQHLFLLLTLL